MWLTIDPPGMTSGNPHCPEVGTQGIHSIGDPITDPKLSDSPVAGETQGSEKAGRVSVWNGEFQAWGSALEAVGLGKAVHFR